jgi:hypothetical protein
MGIKHIKRNLEKKKKKKKHRNNFILFYFKNLPCCQEICLPTPPHLPTPHHGARTKRSTTIFFLRNLKKRKEEE